MNSSETFLDSPLVVELGSRVAVGATGSLLSQLGADVVVIEPAESTVDGKWQNRPLTMSGKRSVVFDTAKDPSSLQTLIRSADIILLSTDIDADTLSFWKHHLPQQIVCDVTAFGHSGPLAGQPLSEGLVEAIAGIIDTTGRVDEAPSVLGTPLIDMHAGVYAAGAIVAALRMKRLYGTGERVEVALYDIGVSALLNFLPLFLLNKPTQRSGNRHPLYGPWGTFEATDGTFLMCAVTDRHWKEICAVMKTPELASDPRFATSSARLDNFPALDAAVQNWVGRKTLDECERRMIEIGIPCGRIVTVDRLSEDANVRHRDMLHTLHDPTSGRDLMFARSPLRADPVTGRSAAAIPARGSSNDFADQLRALASDFKRPLAGTKPAGARPFDGVRVVEIGQYTVAPLASRVLGALGADVIKVEPPTGDVLRQATPFREDGEAFIFAISNTDKRGVVLDLRSEGDCDLLHQILETADVLLENLKPGSLAKLGFGSATLRGRHPRLIYCSVNGFGADSAYPGRPALDTVIQAMSGLMDITRAEGKATKTGISASDNFGGQFGFLAIGAGLELRDRTGIACHFDLSMQDVTVWATQLEWNSRRSPRPQVFQAADGYVAIEGHESEILSVFGQSGGDAREVLARLTREDIIASLPGDLRGQPILTATEVFNNPQTAARNLLVECATPEGDRWIVFSQPFRLSGTPTPVGRVLGRLGSTDNNVRAEFASRISVSAASDG